MLLINKSSHRRKAMRNKPLKEQLRLLTVLLTIIPSLVIMTMYTLVQIQLAKQHNLELIDQRVKSQQRTISIWIAEQAREVRELSQTNEFRTLDEQRMIAALNFAQRLYDSFDSLSFIDKDGNFQITTLKSGIRYPSAENKPYFLAAEAGREYISDVVIGRNSGQPIINFSSPIYDKNGNFNGLILGSIRTETLNILLHDNWIGQTGEVFLVNRQGAMLTEPRHVTALIDKVLVNGSAIMNFKIADDVLLKIQPSQSGQLTWTDYRGKKVLGAYLDVPERGWTIIGKVDEEEVLTPIYRQLALMAGGTVVIVLLILPFATLVTNQLKRPIDWLMGQSRLVATEEYEKVGQEKIPNKIPYELAILCKVFVEMSRKIGQTINHLKANEADLARKVLEIKNINAVLEGEIADRKRAERRYQHLFNSVNDAIFVYPLDGDGNPGTFSGINDAACQVLGYTREELLKLTIFDIDPYIYASFQDLKKQGNVLVETTRISKAGREIPVEVNMNVLESENIVVSIARDITLRKEAEQKVAEAGRRLEQGHRMTMLGVMATCIAHEINQPLNAIIVSTSGVIYALDNGAKYLKADMVKEFRRIAEQADRIDAIIKNIRLLVKNDYTSRWPLSLKRVIDQTVRNITNQAACQGISIRTHIDDNLPSVMANDVHLQQVVVNLITNAMQSLAASSGKSKVIGINAWAEGNIVMEVSDNGSGLPQDMQQKIFEPFITTSQNTNNMGLGLAIVQTIIKAYGGEIRAYNNETGGATFRIELPAVGIDLQVGELAHSER
jgi:PAS domain S-box-containing protein